MSTSPFALGAWIEHWIERYAPLRCASHKTLERYRSLARYLTSSSTPELEIAAGTLLGELEHATLEAGLLSLAAAPGIRHATLSAHTVRHVGELVSAALHKAYLLDLIPENPMRKVELPSFARPDVRALTPSEIRSLREVCRGDWTFLLVELALATGARRGELLALEWIDVAWRESALNISKSRAAATRPAAPSTSPPRTACTTWAASAARGGSASPHATSRRRIATAALKRRTTEVATLATSQATSVSSWRPP
jgi:integrase